MKYLMTMIVLMCCGQAAEATAQQWFGPPLALQEVAETWEQVSIANVNYKIDGKDYTVDQSGRHWSVDQLGCKKIAHSFVEPFICGQRSVKVFCGAPEGAEYKIQVGWKTHFVGNGKTHFGTWVSCTDGVIRPVWAEIRQEVAPAVPTLEILPPESQELVIPKRGSGNSPTLAPLPRLEDGPLLTPETKDFVPPPPAETKGTSDQNKAAPRRQRFDGPVAQTTRR